MGLVCRFSGLINLRLISPIKSFDRPLFLNHHDVIREKINFSNNEDAFEFQSQDLLFSRNSSSIVSLVLKCMSLPISNQKNNHLDKLHGTLVKTAEMMRSAIEIHSKIVGSKEFCFLDMKEKISILEGDLLLADAWKRLGEMKNCQVVEYMATGVGDIITSQFIDLPESFDFHDENLCWDFWVKKNFLQHASLQANSCRSGIILNGQKEDLQMAAYEFGKNFTLAQQALIEMKYFSVDNFGSKIWTEFSAPTLFHLYKTAPLSFGQQDSEYFDNHEKYSESEKFHEKIWRGFGISITRKLKNFFAQRAIESLEKFPMNSAKKTLENLVQDLRFQ
ncbi:all trans-polyprenyl-diphosphate synthase PDSS2-like [Brevipalpus obovatus]|uniref:all trans-polyprenyl-diphosphate synthase PDSS2-like n=1 Tax=Brevipalpus obovatus TaxID=246614 RepID=UPI003D9DE40D